MKPCVLLSLLASLILLSSCNIPFTSYRISGPKPVGYYSRYQCYKKVNGVIVESEADSSRLVRYYGVDPGKIIISIPVDSTDMIDSTQVDDSYQNDNEIQSEESVDIE